MQRVVAPVQPAQEVLEADVAALDRAAAQRVPRDGLERHLLEPVAHLRVARPHIEFGHLLQPPARPRRDAAVDLAVPVNPGRPLGVARRVGRRVVGHALPVERLGALDEPLLLLAVGSERGWYEARVRALVQRRERDRLAEELVRLGGDDELLGGGVARREFGVAEEAPVPVAGREELVGDEPVARRLDRRGLGRGEGGVRRDLEPHLAHVPRPVEERRGAVGGADVVGRLRRDALVVDAEVVQPHRHDGGRLVVGAAVEVHAAQDRLQRQRVLGGRLQVGGRDVHMPPLVGELVTAEPLAAAVRAVEDDAQVVGPLARLDDFAVVEGDGEVPPHREGELEGGLAIARGLGVGDLEALALTIHAAGHDLRLHAAVEAEQGVGLQVGARLEVERDDRLGRDGAQDEHEDGEGRQDGAHDCSLRWGVIQLRGGPAAVVSRRGRGPRKGATIPCGAPVAPIRLARHPATGANPRSPGACCPGLRAAAPHW